MTACGHRVRFVATWREEFFEVPYTLFGCRIVQTADDDLFLTLGEYVFDQAQDLANHLGKTGAAVLES
jgi:Glucose / Sorbosone dehydrogenase